MAVFPWINAFAYAHPFKDDFVGFANLTFIPLDVLVTFLIVGVIEEVAKFLAVKTTAHGKIHSIDDAIEFSVSAALGFAFIENIIYFYNIVSLRGVENILYPFIFRSLFSTFAHVMFSGIFGYYYGLAYFAKPIMGDPHQQEDGRSSERWPPYFIFKKDVSFREEKMMQGLLTAISLHALFNIFLEMNWTFLLIPYLTGGFILLSYLLEKKEDNKVYGFH